MSDVLTASLNPAQHQAVTMTPGPALILAGAGSGKTRVITHRIAWLIEQEHSYPREILAMTFTNRAAREMRERAEELCDMRGGRPMISTFHSACARWLRQYGRLAGLSSNFSIYDTDDTRSVVKRCAQTLAMPTDTSSIRSYLQRIDQAHNQGLSSEDLETAARNREEEEFADLFLAYQDALDQASAVDFGTLITRMLRLLEDNDTFRQQFQRRYRHVLVDEFQDTNAAQYRLLRALAPVDGSVMVVGDDDQSIYGWRGAEVENVRRFVDDYQNVSVIKLEENYRSIAPILDSAHTLVAELPNRMPKKLRAVRKGEDRPVLFVAQNDREEAEYIADKIRALREERALSYDNFAIFYRTNAQSRVFEQRLRSDGIPHRIIGNVGYFDRKEVRDLLAWLRLIANPADDAAFERVRGTPPRGIGAVTMSRLMAFREDYDDWIDALEAWPRTAEAKKSRRSAKGISDLLHLLQEFRTQRKHMHVDELLEAILKRSGYLEWLENAERDSFEDRARNIDELLHLAREVRKDWEENPPQDAPDAPNAPEADALEDFYALDHFLESVTLASAGDSEETADSVQLMTVHTSKGLEFPVVFVTGLEEKIFPLARRQKDKDPDADLFGEISDEERAHQEEERRLAYVAITRAEDRLFLSAAKHRQRFGQVLLSSPSVFLEELAAGDRLAFDPDSSVQHLTWQKPAARVAPHAPDIPPPIDAPIDAGFDQRSWEERSEDVSGELVPDDGVIFDETYYPDESVNSAQKWVGRRARHKLFGVGRIIAADPTGDRVRLTIEFEDVGIKKVIANYIDIL